MDTERENGLRIISVDLIWDKWGGTWVQDKVKSVDEGNEQVS